MNHNVEEATADQDLPEDFTSAWASALLDLHEMNRRVAKPAESSATAHPGDEDCQPDG
ncbi:MAG: hypothetical protein WD069_16175 [Planctomycetales bacterium]